MIDKKTFKFIWEVFSSIVRPKSFDSIIAVSVSFESFQISIGGIIKVWFIVFEMIERFMLLAHELLNSPVRELIDEIYLIFSKTQWETFKWSQDVYLDYL